MDSNKVFGQGGKVGESDKLNIDSIIARLLEGKQCGFFSENKVKKMSPSSYPLKAKLCSYLS